MTAAHGQPDAVRSLLNRMGVDEGSVIDPALVCMALTHSSQGDGSGNNERLEFLGDRVLGLVIAEMIYHRYSDESEGDLALRLAAHVKRDALARHARALGVGDCLRWQDTITPHATFPNDTMLADALEALIGALYLGAGLDTARRAIGHVWGDDIAAMTKPPQDPKTILQEWAQARGMDVPRYVLVDRTGPDHAPSFVIRVELANGITGQGAGTSRRQAEKAAASEALRALIPAPERTA